MALTLVLLVVLIALAFEYINGFHDTANSIATVVATKVAMDRCRPAFLSCASMAPTPS